MMPDPVSDWFCPTTSIDTTTGSTLAAIAAYDRGVPELADTVCGLAPKVAAAAAGVAVLPDEPNAEAATPPAVPETSTSAVRPATSFARPLERWVGTTGSGCGSQLGGAGGGVVG